MTPRDTLAPFSWWGIDFLVDVTASNIKIVEAMQHTVYLA